MENLQKVWEVLKSIDFWLLFTTISALFTLFAGTFKKIGEVFDSKKANKVSKFFGKCVKGLKWLLDFMNTINLKNLKKEK